MYFRCLQIKYTFPSVGCDPIRVQKFGSAVPTAATTTANISRGLTHGSK